MPSLPAASPKQLASPPQCVAIAGMLGALKRVFDFGVSAALLILLLPLIAVLAILIKCHDGGPIFHRRRVLGPKGEFNAFKLRSVRVDADEVLKNDPSLRREFEVNFKLKSDPRVTPLGRMLRKASLDDLPQRWNVLIGQMSLVGPRMISSAELQKFGDAGWIFRCFKPGITGYWQVQGRQDVSYAQRIEMDLFYVSHWSLLLDFRILIKTPIRVLRGAGAY